MAVVGDAYIVVRALTDRVRDDIRRGFDGADREGERAGRNVSDGFGRGFQRGGGSRSSMFRNLQRNAEAAREKFNRLIQIGYALGPALAGLTVAVGGAAAGLFALGAQAAAAGPALLSLINIFSAVAQAAIVLKTVLGGIGAAISAGLRSPGGGGGGGGGIDLTRQIEDAIDRIEDAKERLTLVYQENARRVDQAREAIRDADRAYKDATKSVEEANKRVTESEREVAKAQEATTRAREEALEQIQQLNFALEDAIISEERAVLGYEDALAAYAKAQNLPPNNRARREAELAMKEADLRLRKAKDNTADTQKEVDEANAKGVEGSDLVVNALEREREAGERVTQAKDDLKRAERDLQDAIEDQKKAWDELNYVLEENKRRVRDAKEAIEDAEQALEDLKNSAGGGGGGGGVDAFAEAMAKLAPAAQEFVRWAIEVKKQFDEIAKAAQQEFFSKVNDDIFELVDIYLPMLEKKIPQTASVLADVAIGIIDVFKTPENVERFSRIWDSNDKLIRDFGTSIADLVEILLILMDNLRPVAEEFSGWVKSVTAGWRETVKAKDKTGELSDTFSYAAEVAGTLGDIFGNIGTAIFNLGKAAAGPGSGGEMLMNMLRDVTQGWADFTGSVEGQNKLEQYFKDIVPVASELGGLISDIFGAIFSLAGEGAGDTAEFIGSLREVVGTLRDMGGTLTGALPIIGGFLESAATAINNLTSSGAIENFFAVLKGAADFVAAVTGSALFQAIFSIVAPLFAISRALSLVYTVGRFLFLGAIVGPILQVAGALNAVWGVLGAIAGFLGIGMAPLLAIVAAIAAFIGILVLAWQNSEKFRDAVRELIDKVIAKAVEVFNNLRQKLEDALEPLGGIEGAMETLGQVFGFVGDVLSQTLIPLLEYGLMNAFAIIEAVIGTLIDWIGNLIAAFEKIWTGISTGDIGMVFEGVVDAITAPFRAIWENLSKLFTDIFNNVVNLVKSLLGIASPSTVFADIAQGIIDGLINVLTFFPKLILDIFVKAFDALSSYIKEAWDRIKGIIEGVVNWIRDVVTAIIDVAVGLIVGYYTALWNGIQKIWDGIKGIIEGVVNWFRDTAQTVIETVTAGIQLLFEGLQTAAETIWNAIKTVIETVVNFYRDVIQLTIKTVSKAIETAMNLLKTAVDTAWKGIKTAIKAVADWLENTLKGNVKAVWDAIKEGVRVLKEKIDEYWGLIETAIDTAVKAIKKVLGTIWNGISDALKTVKNAIVGENGSGGIFEKIRSGISSVVDKIKGYFSGIWDNLLDVPKAGLASAFNGAIRIINGIITQVNKIPGVSIPTLDPVTFADGGIVRATRGGVLGIIGEAGRDERVEPLDDKGLSKRDYAIIDYLTGGRGGGTTINVYPSEGMNERELAQKVSRELALQIRRGAI